MSENKNIVYIPPHFKLEDKIQIAQLIEQNSFGTLVSAHNNIPVATHIPLELNTTDSENWILYGHMAKANPQWKQFVTGTEVLAIFLGAHSYISPSWYTAPNVPTWNYLAAHLYGILRMLEGEELENLLQMQMKRYEQMLANKPQPYEAIPAHTLEKDLKGVVGFAIRVTKVEATQKLSQNRDNQSKQNIVNELKNQRSYGAPQIAAEMGKLLDPNKK